MDSSKLITKYQKQMLIIDRILDDLDKNIKLAKKEKEINKDVFNEMVTYRHVLLSKWSIYDEFIKELTSLTNSV